MTTPKSLEFLEHQRVNITNQTAASTRAPPMRSESHPPSTVGR